MNTSSAFGSPRCPLLSRVSLVAVWEMRGKGAREGGKREGEKGHSGGLSHLVPAQRWGGSRYRLSTGRSKRGRCREEEEEEEEEGVVLFSVARMCIEAWSTGVWWTLQCTLYFCAACMTYDELCHVSLTALCFPLTVFQPQGSEAWEPVARWEEQHQDSRLRHGLPSGWRQSAGNQLWVSCTEEHHDVAFWFDVWGKRLRIKWKQVTGGGQVELPGCHREESGGAVENDEWSYQVLCKVPCSQSVVCWSHEEERLVSLTESAIWLWAGARATATHYRSPSPHIWRRVLWPGSHDHAGSINPTTTVMNLSAGKVTFKVSRGWSSISWECFYLTLECGEQCRVTFVNKKKRHSWWWFTFKYWVHKLSDSGG